MPLNIRTYHDLTEPDRSGLPGQIGAQRRRVAERLATVARVVAVMSGKGGVGKSFVTAGVARALARAGRAVGVLDAELAELLAEPPPVVAVTIPPPESEEAVRRALRAARDRGAPCLGVIENMTGGPFSGDAGDALAREFGIPLLARVPFHPTGDVWDAIVPKVESSR